MRYWPILAYAALYAAMLTALRVRHGFDLAEPLFILVVVGIGFSVLAWWSTRRVPVRDVQVRAPRAEGYTMIALLIAVAVFITWGLPAARGLVAPGPAAESVVLVAKLAVFVGLPLIVFRWAWGYGIRDFVDVRSGLAGHWKPFVVMSLAVIVLQLVFGRARADLTALAPSSTAVMIGLVLTFVWLFLEVGIVEEFFFRTLLLERLAAWTRSDLFALVAMALLFGLAHAPGLYLRPELTGEAVGADPSLLMAIGYSVVITSVTGFFLGVLWLRTRNLLLVAAVHAINDLLPGLADHIRLWT